MSARRTAIADLLRQRILSGLHLGTLAPGARLPSTREVCAELGATQRTIVAAYRQLEAEGLLELRERSGIYVAAARPTGGAMLTQLAGWVVEVLLEARAREIPPVEFPERARRCLETLRLRAACIAGNADQLGQIRDELHDDYGIECTGVEPDAIAANDRETLHVLGRADLLVSTGLLKPLAEQLAERLGKPAIAVSLRPDLMGELMRQLARGPVYIVGTDPRFRAALRGIFGPSGYADNVRPVILGEDDPDAIPADAPTHVMRSAHRQLGDTPLARRVTPLRRVFSDDMARELLTFVIRANMVAMSARSA
ncbi:MAG: Transcriptional regulator, GntR family domain / Aspartate aminotransferase [uncultured Gemmatimonadaceae bacterium]|uniref:Transcriptional regulator, GntR family domain / Aspartate aminotransferase n=1 Tax=uncultured Gemmatimonadaceae bacterium TaxID=246130 RepID=A0A6J4MBP4_9BACT|nr:MAG: Transcriptional regulator, GntR family domain / Aspartate aminotransferase [uncultured Gemmatimonadaceae bacterium]